MAIFGVAGAGGGGEGGGLVDLNPVSTSSGTAHDIATELPDDCVYAAIALDGISTTAANRLVIRLGTSQGIVATGYSGIYTDGTNLEGEEATSGFHINASSASDPISGIIEFRRIGNSNKWLVTARSNDGLDFLLAGGTVTLSGRLTKIQLTLNTISGTNAFDAGQAAAQYSTRKGVGPIANTGDLPEGSNKYWTDARAAAAFAAALANADTDDLSEGSGNLYFTDARADERIRNASLTTLSDVSGTPTDGQALIARVSGTVTTWEPGTVAAGSGTGGVSTIASATDTNLSGLQAKNVLLYNAANSKWENESITDVVGVSNTGMNVTLSTALDGGAVAVTANVGNRALTLGRLTAGGATPGHALLVGSDGNEVVTGSVTGGNGNGPTTLSGLLDVANSVGTAASGTIFAKGTGSEFTAQTISGSGSVAVTSSGTNITVTGDPIPEKAGPEDWGRGTDDDKFLTVKGARAMRRSADNGTIWTGFNYVTGSTPGAGQFTIEGTNSGNNGYTFKFNFNSDADATKADEILDRNAEIILRKDASNRWSGKVEFAWRGDGNIVGFEAKPGMTETGDIRTTAVSFQAVGELFNDLRDQGFKVGDDFRQGTGITITTDTDGRLTISSTVMAGSGTVTYASVTSAKRGIATNESINPFTLHAVLDEAPHVAPYQGMQHTASTGAAMALGTWNINSDGTVANYRFHNLEEQNGAFAEMTTDKTAMHRKGGELIQYDYTATPVLHSIDGQTVGYVSVAIGSHVAIPANPTLAGDWEISFQPSENRKILERAPAESIPLLALATQPGGQMTGDNAAGNSAITLTTFGSISDTDFRSANLSATRTGLLPIPHPNQSTTPTGTGIFTITPRSAKSNFAILANVGFGWIEVNSDPKVHFICTRKIGSGGWTVVDRKENVVNGDNLPAADINVTPLFFDSPNTTDAVSYRVMIVRGNSVRVYPIGQTVIVIESPNT